MYIGKRFQPGCRALQPETKARLFYDEAGSLRLPQLYRIIWMPRTKTKSAAAAALAELNARIVACTRCPRLREYTANIAVTKRRAYLDHDYWGLPVPSFGDPDARVLLVGLAPGAHGSNRTGRPFTGDGSGAFLFPVLYEAGFASQPIATKRDDGMQLHDAWITSVVRCAPPDNKPLPSEIANCAPYLDEEMAALKNLRVIVCLGKIGFDGVVQHLIRTGEIGRRGDLHFAHGAEYKLPNGRFLLATYHPSLQNTNTGKLTNAMFYAIFRRARELAGLN
jgi:uracil-DNA glycosylase family 4